MPQYHKVKTPSACEFYFLNLNVNVFLFSDFCFQKMADMELDDDLLDDGTNAANMDTNDVGIDIEVKPSRMRNIELPTEFDGKVISRKNLDEWTNNDNNDNEYIYNGDMELDNSDDDDDGNNYNSIQKKILSQTMQKNLQKAERLKSQSIKLMETSNKNRINHQIRKSKAVTKQTKFYDKVASLRIHLQKPLQMAQKLPRLDKYNTIIKKDKKLKELFDKVSQQSLILCDNINRLQSKMLINNKDYPEDLIEIHKQKLDNQDDMKLNFDELMNDINNDWELFMPYSNKILDIWDRKMKLIDSYDLDKTKKNKNNSNKNIETLIEKIAIIMDNPERLLQKMQSVDNNFRMYLDEETKTTNNDDQKEVIKSSEDNPSHSLKFNKYKMEPETFNDSQFYKRMLKELIDIGNTTLNNREITNKMDEIQSQKTKDKLNLKRLRTRMKYTVRPDMENFMTPAYDEYDPEFPYEQLYNSLFQ